jgi:hypothetical protein
MSLINTVEDSGTNKYSQHDYSNAELARKIQKIIGRPSTKTMLSIVDKSCWQTVLSAALISSPQNRYLVRMSDPSKERQYKRKTSSPVQADYTCVSKAILSRYQEVSVAGDIMFVKKLPFFVTISQHIKFGTSKFLANHKTETILKAIKHIRQTYSKRGF